MKTFFLFILSIFFLLPAVYSQAISDVPLENLDSEYISISPAGMLGKRQIAIQIDFGQPTQPFSPKESQIKDSKGKPMEFNTVIEALNFLNKYGYELVTVVSSGSGKEEHAYLMKKNWNK